MQKGTKKKRGRLQDTIGRTRPMARLCAYATYGSIPNRARLRRFTAVQHEYGPARVRLRALLHGDAVEPCPIRGRAQLTALGAPERSSTLTRTSANTARLDLAMLFQFAVLQTRSILPLLVGQQLGFAKSSQKPRLETRGLVCVSNHARPTSDMSHDPRTATPFPKLVPVCGLLLFDRGPLGPQDLPASREV